MFILNFHRKKKKKNEHPVFVCCQLCELYLVPRICVSEQLLRHCHLPPLMAEMTCHHEGSSLTGQKKTSGRCCHLLLDWMLPTLIQHCSLTNLIPIPHSGIHVAKLTHHCTAHLCLHFT